MNRAAFAEPIILQKDTRAVILGFKGVFPFNIFFADLAVGKAKVTGHSVDVFGSNVERCIFEPVATIPGAEITIYFVVKLRCLRSVHAWAICYLWRGSWKLPFRGLAGVAYLPDL